MSPIDPDHLERARKALEKLIQGYIHHPDVTLIDIGLDPNAGPGELLALRVHVRQSAAKETLQLPAEVDGFPVYIETGDYRPE